MTSEALTLHIHLQMKNPATERGCVMFCAVRTTIRIAWLITGTLLVARVIKSLLDWILWHETSDTLRLPGRYFSFVPCLNAAALLAVSFALVVTCAWWIERRLEPRR